MEEMMKLFAMAGLVAAGGVACTLVGVGAAYTVFRLEQREQVSRAPMPARPARTSADEVEEMDTTTGSIPGVYSLAERRNRPRLA